VTRYVRFAVSSCPAPFPLVDGQRSNHVHDVCGSSLTLRRKLQWLPLLEWLLPMTHYRGQAQIPKVFRWSPCANPTSKYICCRRSQQLQLWLLIDVGPWSKCVGLAQGTAPACARWWDFCMSAMPRKRTCAAQLAMSAMGQKRTHAAQQKWWLFDHFIGDSEQRRRDCKTKRFGSL